MTNSFEVRLEYLSENRPPPCYREWEFDAPLEIFGASSTKSLFFLILTQTHELFICRPTDKGGILWLRITENVTTAYISGDYILIAKGNILYIHKTSKPEIQINSYKFEANIIKIKCRNQLILIFLQNQSCYTLQFHNSSKQEPSSLSVNFFSVISVMTSDDIINKNKTQLSENTIILHNTLQQNIHIIGNTVYFTTYSDESANNLKCIYSSDITKLKVPQEYRQITSSSDNIILDFDTITTIEDNVEAIVSIRQMNQQFIFTPKNPEQNSSPLDANSIHNKIKINYIAAQMKDFNLANTFYLIFFTQVINQFHYNIQLEYILGQDFFISISNAFSELSFDDIYHLLRLILLRKQKSVFNHTIITSMQAEKLNYYAYPTRPPLVSTLTNIWNTASHITPPDDQYQDYYIILIKLISDTNNLHLDNDVLLNFLKQESYIVDGQMDIQLLTNLINCFYSRVLHDPNGEKNLEFLLHSLRIYKLLNAKVGKQNDSKINQLKQKITEMVNIIIQYNQNVFENVIEPYINSEIINDIDNEIIENQFCTYDVFIQKIEEKLNRCLPFRFSAQKKNELKSKSKELYRTNLDLFHVETKIKVLENTFKKSFYIGLRKISYH